MGICGSKKIEVFEGTPDEEIQFHSVNITLAVRSEEKGSGPQRRIEESIRGAITTANKDGVELQTFTANKFAEAIEILRGESFAVFFKNILAINEARIAICKRINYSLPENLLEGDFLWKSQVYSSIRWIPRVISLEENCRANFGSTAELGMSGPGAEALGYTFECWIQLSESKVDKDCLEPIDILDTWGTTMEGRKASCCPHFFIDREGKVGVDIQGSGCNSGKSKPIEAGVWTHVAFVHHIGQLRLFVGGRRIADKPCGPLKGEVSLVLCQGKAGLVVECRLWNCARSDSDIMATMNVSIPPHEVRLYGGLRFSWLPLRLGGSIRQQGSLMYDAWERRSVGSRSLSHSIADSRWTSIVPASLIPTLSSPYKFYPDHTKEWNEEWESCVVGMVTPAAHSSAAVWSSLDMKALKVVEMILKRGGPWIPRVVSFPPQYGAVVGTTEELGLTGTNGFTIECWVRVRVLSPEENCIIGIGTGSPYSKGSCLHIGLRGGKPYASFLGEKDAESIVGLPRMHWTHLSFTYDNQAMKIYANGALIASRESQPIQGNSTLVVGSSNGKSAFTGDICELRVWSRALSEKEVNDYMKIPIPPIAARGYKDLRLTWFPLRKGGPSSHERWVNMSSYFKEMQKFEIPAAAVAQLDAPVPTLFWDVAQNRDTGRMTNADALLATRTRSIHIAALIPNDDDYPAAWSRSAIALIDDWTDSYDRIFAPRWYQQFVVECGFDDGYVDGYGTAAALVARAGSWTPRCARSLPRGKHSMSIGLTAELGLCGVGTGGREFALELWIRPRPYEEDDDKKKIFFRDIIGHEDAESTQSTGFFGLGSPAALRIGLANGFPFMSFIGPLKSMKPGDAKEGVLSPVPIPHSQWTHLAFVAVGDGKMQLFINGKLMASKDRIGPLEAKGDRVLTMFGAEDRLLASDVCEIRLWGCARKEAEIQNYMTQSIPPMSDGMSRVQGLRLAWFPLVSSKSLFWDTKYLLYRGDYGKETGQAISMPIFTRRPHFLPPAFQINDIPNASILNDRGDAFERVFCSALVPPVYRDMDGYVVDQCDPNFVPLSNSLTKSKSFISCGYDEDTRNTDIGWNDIDDGSLYDLSQAAFDDGGFWYSWGDDNLSMETDEDVIDPSQSIVPIANSRRPSKAAIVDETMLDDAINNLNFNPESTKMMEQGSPDSATVGVCKSESMSNKGSFIINQGSFGPAEPQTADTESPQYVTRQESRSHSGKSDQSEKNSRNSVKRLSSRDSLTHLLRSKQPEDLIVHEVNNSPEA